MGARTTLGVFADVYFPPLAGREMAWAVPRAGGGLADRLTAAYLPTNFHAKSAEIPAGSCPHSRFKGDTFCRFVTPATGLHHNPDGLFELMERIPVVS